MSENIDHQVIAVVDDDLPMAEMICDMLTALGLLSELHTTANSFLETRLNQKYSAVVLDISMPEMDGFELLHRMRSENIAVPLILVSGHPQTVINAARMIGEKLGLEILGTLRKPFRQRDLAGLMQAKAISGRNTKVQQPVVTESELSEAITNGELEVYMQPQIQMETGVWYGMEALVRWQHPEKGLLMPDSFIPLAEEHGLILAITRSVTQAALRVGKMIEREFGFTGTISVNLAPVSLTDHHFPDVMSGLAALAGWEPARLCFEVTETSVAADPVMALEILSRLSIKGFKLSIDDFGTGHSSLENLSLMPISELKIDMSFIRPAMTDNTARIIVEETIHMAHSLGFEVVAEGVETEQHWHWLRSKGCDYAQGYFISKPMHKKDIGLWFIIDRP